MWRARAAANESQSRYDDPPGVVDEHVAPRAKAGQGAPRREAREHRGDPGVNRVPTLAKGPRPCFGRGGMPGRDASRRAHCNSLEPVRDAGEHEGVSR